MPSNKEKKSSKSEKPLNFETDDFSSKNFLDFIEEPTNKKIKFFSVLLSKKDKLIEPLIFWLNTNEKKWYRFFIDAWLTHWDEYNEIEKTKIIKDDFEEYDEYFVRDLVEELGLNDKVINEIEVSRFFEKEQYIAQIKISIEEHLLIIIRDFGDKKPAELLILNNKE